MINNTGIFDLICLTLLHNTTYKKIHYYIVPHKCGIFKLKKKKQCDYGFKDLLQLAKQTSGMCPVIMLDKILVSISSTDSRERTCFCFVFL